MSNASPALSFSILYLNAVIFIFKLTKKKLSNHTNFQGRTLEEILGENLGNNTLYIRKQGLCLMQE
jgi:hypothetical protein